MTATKPKPSASPFATARTREALADAIQHRLAVGRLRAIELRAADAISRLRGWDQPATRHFVGEKFSQAGVNYVATAIDEAGQISEAKEIIAPAAHNTAAVLTPDAPEFV